jgi:hypothetical protein
MMPRPHTAKGAGTRRATQRRALPLNAPSTTIALVTTAASKKVHTVKPHRNEVLKPGGSCRDINVIPTLLQPARQARQLSLSRSLLKYRPAATALGEFEVAGLVGLRKGSQTALTRASSGDVRLRNHSRRG